MKKWLTWLVLGLCILIGSVASAQPQIPPAPTSSIYVQDYAGVLSSDTEARINAISEQLAAKTKAQIVVVTVKSLQGSALEDYSLSLLRNWGIGDKQLNNGVLMLVALNDRKSRIEVGYGLEGALPDAKTGRIQDEYMLPFFRNGDYNRGILNGYLALAGEVAKEYKTTLNTDIRPVRQVSRTGNNYGQSELPWWAKLLIGAGIVVFFIIDWLLLGGFFTRLIFYMLLLGGRGGRGGRGGGGGFGGGSGGGGGSSRGW